MPKYSQYANGAPILLTDELLFRRAAANVRGSALELSRLIERNAGLIPGVVNPDMKVSQENGATPVSLTVSLQYILDQWAAAHSTTPGVSTAFQGAVGAAGRKCLILKRNNGSANTGKLTAITALESLNAAEYAGLTVPFRFEALGGGNYSPAGALIRAIAYYGTGIDQSFASLYAGTWAGQASLTDANYAVNTDALTWKEFSVEITVPAAATQLGIYFEVSPTGVAGPNDYVAITNVGVGRARLPGELDLLRCRRFLKLTGAGGVGRAVAAGTFQGTLPGFDVPMRAAPTLTIASGVNPTVDEIAAGTRVSAGSALAVINSPTARGGGDFSLTGFAGMTSPNLCVIINDCLLASSRL